MICVSGRACVINGVSSFRARGILIHLASVAMSKAAISPARILIGEDTPDMAYLMRFALEGAGYSVETTPDGEACLARARETLPDLILLDIMMPKMHGIAVLRALRADPSTRHLPVLVCTAKDFKTEYEQCIELGVVDVLIKPQDTPLLVEKVNAFLRSKDRGEPAAPAPESRSIVPATAPYLPQIETPNGRISLWGTRGSTPTPGARFLRHGGHTSCMSLVVGDEHLIFDAGSGIRELGVELNKHAPRKLHLFITHTHWDHIQGFPFFLPAYLDGYEINIYGAPGFRKDLQSVFSGQLDREYFPVQMEDMKADIHFRHLSEPPMQIGRIRISWELVQHPGATLGFKAEVDGKTIVWIPDNEIFQGYLGDPAELHRDHPLVTPFGRIIDFMAGADVAIHEAQYTNEDYAKKLGWGHSSVSNAAALIKLAGVKRWIAIHHDPSHDDAFLETKLNLTRQILKRLGHPIEVVHGYDGMTEYL